MCTSRRARSTRRPRPWSSARTGRACVVDPAVTAREVDGLAAVIRDRGWTPVAVWSTHAHWDHVLDGPGFSPAPPLVGGRRGRPIPRRWRPSATPTPSSPAPARPRRPIAALRTPYPRRSPGRARLGRPARARPGAPARTAARTPPCVLPDVGVLVAGDMLSDVEIPLLDLTAADPVGDYLRGAGPARVRRRGRRRPWSRPRGVRRRARPTAGRRPRVPVAPSSPGRRGDDDRLALPWAAAAHEAQRSAVAP